MQAQTTIKINALKCGGRTYFFDIKVAKNGSNYLIITESRFIKDEKEAKRNSFILFKEDFEGFKNKLNEITL
ncbi:MAG: DUF3276 family protein [bacterium]|nr:DUF3276 family protein [bacterium]